MSANDELYYFRTGKGCAMNGKNIARKYDDQLDSKHSANTDSLSVGQHAERLLRLDGVSLRTGMRRSTLYAAISRGDFPKPVKLGARSVAWLESEITAWIDSRIKASREVSA